jgi:hypothetical protein
LRFVLAVSVLAVGTTIAAASPGGASSSRPVAIPCKSNVQTGVLPTWARGGFSDPKPRLPHVLGNAHRIVAILFGYPLLSPPSPRRNNKILWVARRTSDGSTLRIRAQRMNGSSPVGAPVLRRVAGGPGPSIVNLPAPGCWRLTLHWSGRSDSLDLSYRRR